MAQLSTPQIDEQIQRLNAHYEGRGATAIIDHAVHEAFADRIAFVSSFGAESAVLLHLLAVVDPSVPVLFLDTNKLFGETVRYRSRLQHQLGLEDVRVIGPRKRDIERDDPQGTLSMHDPDKCCELRKAEPLERALKGFDCWVTGPGSEKRWKSWSMTARALNSIRSPHGPAPTSPSISPHTNCPNTRS